MPDDEARAADPAIEGADLMALAVHRSPSVRAAIARRPDCPMGALISLGYDHDLVVLEAVLHNARTPSSVIRALADHRHTRISDLAVQRLRNSYR